MLKDKIDFIQPSFHQLSDRSNGVMFFVRQTSFAILWNKKYFFLFDSHSRDDQGKVAPDGTGILLKFSSLRQVQKYILENYLLDCESVFCQIQFVRAENDSKQNPLTQVEKRPYLGSEILMF